MQAKNNIHRKVSLIGGIAALIMFGFCFAMVPLYGLICKKTGLNTTITTDLITKTQADKYGKEIDMSRPIQVQFTATNHMGMPWSFYPETKIMTIHPGEKAKVFFYAKNPTTRDMVAQAIPSMTPPEAIEHFHKIECFCFNQQKLTAGQKRDMAIVFQVDKDLPKHVKTITLAYTLFDTTPKVSNKG